jgi:putative Holliday junction resolvase
VPDTPDLPNSAPTTALAFDFGTRHIGFAVGQTLTGSSRPLAVLRVKDGQPVWPEILKYIDEWQPDLLIVGLPLNANGTESDFCLRARKFAKRLMGRTGHEVIMVDERFSTREAKLKQPSGNYRTAPVDALAAALILESWLRHPDIGISP